jgi:hypothetical protein
MHFVLARNFLTQSPEKHSRANERQRAVEKAVQPRDQANLPNLRAKRLLWIEHVQRMNESNRVPKNAY